MRVYVAASQHDWQRARDVMDACTRAGHTVSHDWTCEVEDHLTRPATEGELYRYATVDKRGVGRADVLLALTPERADWGCALWTELGFALARHMRCIVTGPRRDANIFSRLCERYETDAEGLDALGR